MCVRILIMYSILAYVAYVDVSKMQSMHQSRTIPLNAVQQLRSTKQRNIIIINIITASRPQLRKQNARIIRMLTYPILE